MYKTKFLSLLLLLSFFAVLFIGVKNQSQSWYFQDETEHVTLGWMMTEYGRHLYTYLSTNHQPLPILVGSLSKYISYNTLFVFIDNLRVLMWFFAFVTSFFIVFRFQWRGLLSVMLTYSLSHYFFGWHVLAESLVIPSVIWILLSIFDKKVLLSDKIIFGFSSFWITFSLLPLWPFVLVSNFYYFWSKKNTIKFVLVGFLVPTLILFMFINPFNWWQETIINNVMFYLPYEATQDIGHYFRLLFYPFLYLSQFENQIARFYLALTTLLITSFLLFKKQILQNKKSILKLVIFALLIASLNPRISLPSDSPYELFHLFPYVAGISVLISVILSYVYSYFKTSTNARKILIAECIFVCLILINNLQWVWEKRDKLSDYYIKYDTFQAYGNALKTIKNDGDTLITGPNGVGYLNMMAGIPIFGKQNFHLEWSYRVPYLRDYWLDMMENEPPTFIFFNLENSSHSQILKPILDQKYTMLKRSDGSDTQLYILINALKKITREQWKSFENQSFVIPAIITND
ncbi:hypothetical protein KA089_01565 [Candidatus Woesebacteria bacterium]|nr:hypothetical protein [Candidatus Woesebacteria bacterium]